MSGRKQQLVCDYSKMGMRISIIDSENKQEQTEAMTGDVNVSALTCTPPLKTTDQDLSHVVSDIISLCKVHHYHYQVGV